MKTGWETNSLGNVCEVKRGRTITKKETIGGDIPVIGGGMKPTYYHNIANRESGCITISGSGASAGYVNMWDKPIFASDCSTIEPIDDSQMRKFIYYYLCSMQEYIYDNFRAGSAQPHVYARDIATLEYPLVPIEEQKRIVAVLDAAFAKIETARDNILSNIEDAQKAQQSLFIKAFSVKAKMRNLGDVATFQRGLTYSKSDEVDKSSNCVLRANNVSLDTGRLDLSELKFISDKIKIPENKYVKSGSLLICTASGSKSHLGKVALINEDMGYAFGGFMGQITPNDEVLPEYLYLYMNSGKYREFISNLSAGTNINNLKWSQLEKFEMPTPPLDEQKQIVSRLTAFKDKGEEVEKKYQSQLADVETLRQSLLQKAFAGELT